MKMTSEDRLVDLAPHGALQLRQARGATIRCVAGSLWLTEDGRGEDVILAPGAAYRVRGDRPVVVSARRAARLAIAAPSAPCRRAGLYARLRAAALALAAGFGDAASSS